jgi:AraC family ethanolamine operon transcriptional activator
MERLVSREFLDVDHFSEQLRGRDTPAIQIEPGPISIRFRSIDLNGMIFSENRVNRRLIDHSRIEHGWIYFAVNLSPAIFCGTYVDVGHMTVLNSGREYRSIIYSNWHAIEILIESSALTEEGIWLAPHLILDPEEASISLPVELVRIFRRLAEIAFDRHQNGPVDGTWLRAALLRALDKALRIGARGLHGRYPRPEAEGYGLTLRMIRYIESRFGQRIAVNEVASELNVTPRALHYATRSALGMSPLDLILAFRLNHVRNEFWDMRLSEASITQAALMQDFGHLGRFSQQYRVLFGELPSQTLRRIRALAD